jgi:DNA mismatch repair protein MutL
MRQYRAVSEDAQRERRLGAICGTTFMQHALRIEWQHDDLALRGWVADPHGSRQVTDLQYCYVNGRMMRDKLINHAIRQAYQTQLGDDQQPAYVLYLEIDPHQVDVNVHPAKHEVRFHQSRLVHDFIWQGVMSALQASRAPELPIAHAEEPAPKWQPENRQAAGANHFAQPSNTPRSGGASAAANANWQNKEPVYSAREGNAYKQLMKTPMVETPRAAPVPAAAPVRLPEKREAPLAAHAQSFGRVLSVLQDRYALLERGSALQLLSLAVAARWLKQAQLEPGEEGLKPQPLLIPVRLKIAAPELAAIADHAALLSQMGIDLQREGQHVTLRAVPLPLRTQNLQILIPELLGYLARQQENTATQLAQWLARRDDAEDAHWNHSQAIALLAELERLCPQLLKSPPSGLLQTIEIESALNALKHE